jgi:hypothetical protein
MTYCLCASDKQVEFAAEVLIHFPGLKNLVKPGVLVFPTLLVCLGCGCSRFTVPNAPQLRLLEESINQSP